MQQLFDAIKAGRIDDVRAALDRDPSALSARDANGVSAILFAIYHGRVDMARVFVERGARLDVFEASAIGAADRVSELIGTDPALVSAFAPDGFYPLGLAAFFGHAAVVGVLISAGADAHAVAKNAFKVQPIHAAAASKNLTVVRAVLEAGADPNVPQQQGFVPLHEAASSGNRELAELLIAHGADPRVANDAGKTSIALATEKGHADLAVWLEG